VAGGERERDVGDGAAICSRNKAYFYLQEVLGWAIYLLEALLARIWHSLHDDGSCRRKACSSLDTFSAYDMFVRNFEDSIEEDVELSCDR